MRSCLIGLSALVAVILMTSAASAATITEVLSGTGPFDPTQLSFYDYGFGHVSTLLSWDSYGPSYLFNRTGHATGNFTAPDPSLNPSWLNFQVAGGNSSGGGGGGGGSSDPNTLYQHSYTLSNNNLQDWTMDFSVLIFDPEYAGGGMQVELLGSKEGADTYKAKTLTPDEVRGGMMLTWDIQAAGDESVLVRTTSMGEDEYAAGYFINDADPGIPEPATLAFLALGACGVLAGRMRRG